MSVAALAPKPAAPAESPQREHYRFSVAQYQKMAQTGILGPDDHVELLGGWIFQKMSRNPPHDYTLNYVNLLLARLLPAIWVLRNQSALILAHSVPEPDFAIVRGPAKEYMKRHPRPSDAVLLIEVADSSRMRDRREKGLWYAEARIPEFWLVNLVEGIVEVYTQPKGGKSPAYRQRKDYQQGDKVPFMLDGLVIAHLAVSDLCPTKV